MPWPEPTRRRDLHAFTRGVDGEALEADAPRPAPDPGVLLASYTWGMEARRIGALSPDARIKVMTEAVAAFHPEIAEYVDDGASIFWASIHGAWGRMAIRCLTVSRWTIPPP